MNTTEAKEKLLLYRGPIDDENSGFEEALALARRDPELGQWLRDQGNSYDAIRSKLREIEPPPDLAETIIRQRPIRFRRGWVEMLKLAAVIVILLGSNCMSAKNARPCRDRKFS
jgi:hypothetical protein